MLCSCQKREFHRWIICVYHVSLPQTASKKTCRLVWRGITQIVEMLTSAWMYIFIITVVCRNVQWRHFILATWPWPWKEALKTPWETRMLRQDNISFTALIPPQQQTSQARLSSFQQPTSSAWSQKNHFPYWCNQCRVNVWLHFDRNWHCMDVIRLLSLLSCPGSGKTLQRLISAIQHSYIIKCVSHNRKRTNN